MAGRSPVEVVAQDGMVGTTYPTDELSHPEYVNDDFRMFTFKVMKCPKRYVHDWRSCPFAHPTENARRRDPREVRYMPVPCPDYKRGLCLMGDSCTYSHGVYECWLHPAKYRTQLCKDGAQCRRPVCFFAHSVSELRSPTYTWDSSEGAVANGKQAPLGLQDGALPQGAHGHGGHNQGHAQDPGHMNYPDPGHDHNGSQAFHYQQQERHQAPPMQDHLDPSQASMGYPYPPAQHHVPYMDPYYAPHPSPNPGMDGYGLGMHMIANPQMPNPNQGGFNNPFPAPGVPRMYPPPPRHAMEAPGMAGMPHVTPYQREQQRLHSMHRYHSQQLSEQQLQQQQQPQMHRQPSGPAPAGSLPSTSAASARSGTPSGAPSADLGDLLNAGGGQGTTAPRMSNAMARSLGLVPPKETRTRTLGALAGLMQGPRATSLTDGVNRPQMSYSLPAQLPDPDQHMHEVYMAAQAAAAGNTTQGTLSQSIQRQASMGLPPPSMGSGGTLSSGLSQTVRQASLGLPQGPGTIGPVTRQQSLGLPQSQGSLGLAPSASLGTAQRQGSLGLPFEPSPQDLQAWQHGLQQGIKGTQASQQKGSGQLDGASGLAQTAQGRVVMEQLQGLGVFADGGGNLNSGQLQGLVTMLSKQGVPQKYGHTISSLAGQTIPEAEQVAGVSVDDHALATLLNSFQKMGVTSTQPKKAQTEQTLGVGQVHVASPFASPDHAPSLDFLEGGDPKAVGGMRSGSHQPGRAASLDSSSQSGLLPPQATSANRASPFASPIQQMHKVSSNSSAGSVPGRSPSGRTSQTTSRQASSSPLPSPHTSAGLK